MRPKKKPMTHKLLDGIGLDSAESILEKECNLLALLSAPLALHRLSPK
jgi:hypothetical protein